MFCSNCGNEIQAGANFCPKCGKQLVQMEQFAAVMPQVAQATEKLAKTIGTIDAGKPQDIASMMKLVNPLDGSAREVNLTPQQIVELNASCQSDEEYNDWIDNLAGLDATPVNKALKTILKQLVGFTVQAGKLVFKMGKVILTNVIKIVRAFKNTIAGAVAGFIIGTIFSTIPLIGFLLGPIVTPALMAVGMIAGFMVDMKEKIHDAEIEAKIREHISQKFSDLNR